MGSRQDAPGSVSDSDANPVILGLVPIVRIPMDQHIADNPDKGGRHWAAWTRDQDHAAGKLRIVLMSSGCRV